MDYFFREQFTLDRIARTLFYILLIAIIVWGISSIWTILLPFLLAGIFSYVVLPWVKFLQHNLRLKNRSLSVIIVFILLCTIIIWGISYLLPAIQSEIEKTMRVLAEYDHSKSIWEIILPDFIANQFSEEDINIYLRDFITTEKIIEYSKTALSQINGVVNSTLSLFSWGMVFAMGIVYFVFILMDFEDLAKGFVNLFPQTLRPLAKNICKEFDYNMNNYFRGQALVALCVAFMMSLAFSIIGLPMAIALGIFIGILNFVPYMQLLGLIPLTLLAILMSVQDGQNVLWSLTLAYGSVIIVQILQDTIVVPKIMGKQMGMRPSLILLAIAIWGYLLGFFGMLIALPLTMSIYSIYMKYVLKDEEYIKWENKNRAIDSTKEKEKSKK